MQFRIPPWLRQRRLASKTTRGIGAPAPMNEDVPSDSRSRDDRAWSRRGSRSRNPRARQRTGARRALGGGRRRRPQSNDRRRRRHPAQGDRPRRRRGNEAADARADRPADHVVGGVGGQQRLELRLVRRFFPQPRRQHNTSPPVTRARARASRAQPAGIPAIIPSQSAAGKSHARRRGGACIPGARLRTVPLIADVAPRKHFTLVVKPSRLQPAMDGPRPEPLTRPHIAFVRQPRRCMYRQGQGQSIESRYMKYGLQDKFDKIHGRVIVVIEDNVPHTRTLYFYLILFEEIESRFPDGSNSVWILLL